MLVAERDMRRVFEQEISVCSKLHHPHIAAVCGVVRQDDGTPIWLVMELLQGSMCDVMRAARLSGKCLTFREQVDMSRDCLSGLQYLHQLVHQLTVIGYES